MMKRKQRHGPDLIRCYVANMDKERNGDGPYTRYLLMAIGAVGLLFRQEVGHGLASTRIRGVGMRVERFRTWVVGRVGVHRGVAVGRVRIGNQWVWVFSMHGLHLRSTSEEVRDAYLVTMAKRFRLLNEKNALWIVGFDANVTHRTVARMFGGQSVGEGIIGLAVSPGLRILNSGVDDYGTTKGRKWSDHPAYWADIDLAPKRAA